MLRKVFGVIEGAAISFLNQTMTRLKGLNVAVSCLLAESGLLNSVDGTIFAVKGTKLVVLTSLKRVCDWERVGSSFIRGGSKVRRVNTKNLDLFVKDLNL